MHVVFRDDRDAELFFEYLFGLKPFNAGNAKGIQWRLRGR